MLSCFLISSTSFVIYNLGFLELMPEFECNYPGNSTTFPCKEKNFCGTDIEYNIVQGEDSLDNWVEKLGLICRPSWQIGLLGSSLFIGWSLTTLWLPKLADTFGRKKLVWAGAMIDLFLMTVMFISKSFWLTVGTIFVIGLVSSVRVTVNFTLQQEYIGKKHRVMYGTIWHIQDGLVVLYAAVYFW